MKKQRLFAMLAVLLILVVIGVVGSVAAQESTPMPVYMPALGDLEAGWNTLVPGGDTICSNGTQYSFDVRPAESNNLLIYFNGGGACWFGAICDLNVQPTYSPFADMPANIPDTQSGIFDFANTENPFADYNMVFIPYCTADVHIGDSDTTYDVPAMGDKPAHQVTIHHQGYADVTAVLDWVFANFDSPDAVFVAGSSAGSIPSPFYAAPVAEQYPDARITQLGDGSGAYRSDKRSVIWDAWGTFKILPDWPEYADKTPDTLSFEDFFIATAAHYPNVMFSEYNTAYDETQTSFLQLLGESNFDLLALLEADQNDVRAGGVEHFATYTAGGTLHTILRRPEMYTYDVDGVRFIDWLTALANGDPVDDVLCTDCQTAPDAGQ